MIFLPRLFFIIILIYSQVTLARTQLIQNDCETASTLLGALHLKALSNEVPLSADLTLRFLGFDVIKKQGEPYLRARFAASQLEYAYFDVYTEDSTLHCGVLVPESIHSERQAWAVDLPVSEALNRLQDTQTLGIWVFSERLVDGQQHQFVTELNYDKAALLALLRHNDETSLPYALKMQHPSDLNHYSNQKEVVYCLNSWGGDCDYTHSDHPNYDGPWQEIAHLILPIKGEVVVEGYITRLLFKEDIELEGLNIAATDFGIWNYANPLNELGALRGNAKAFLAPFFTLTYHKEPNSETVKTKIAWDIPLQYGEFLHRSSYFRDYETYWLMSLAYEYSSSGGQLDGKQRSYVQKTEQTQKQINFIAISGLNEAKNGSFKLAPLKVTYP